MAEQIRFFEKNIIDYANTSVVATATEGSAYADYVRNRSNDSAWVTTGSTDASLTELEINFGDARYIDSIFLVEHNFKAFTVQYWDGAAWQSFSPAISQTTNTLTTNLFQFTEVLASRVKVTIQGTMVANEDKRLCQLIVTSEIGQFNGWPQITGVKHTRVVNESRMLSGKSHVTQSVGGFIFSLEVPNWRNEADLDLIEELHFRADPFLVWLSGGDEDQFSSPRIGYRRKDFYLCRVTSPFEPVFAGGLYSSGLALKIDFAEVIE